MITEGNEGNEAIFWNGTIFVCFVAFLKSFSAAALVKKRLNKGSEDNEEFFPL